MVGLDAGNVQEFLYKVFSSWWQLQENMGNLKNATILRGEDTIETECVVGIFTPKEIEGYAERIPLGAKKYSFTQEIYKDDIIQIDSKSYTPILISDMPWGEVREFIITLVENEQQ